MVIYAFEHQSWWNTKSIFDLLSFFWDLSHPGMCEATGCCWLHFWWVRGISSTFFILFPEVPMVQFCIIAHLSHHHHTMSAPWAHIDWKKYFCHNFIPIEYFLTKNISINAPYRVRNFFGVRLRIRDRRPQKSEREQY